MEASLTRQQGSLTLLLPPLLSGHPDVEKTNSVLFQSGMDPEDEFTIALRVETT
jgi:hypothetical protein